MLKMLLAGCACLAPLALAAAANAQAGPSPGSAGPGPTTATPSPPAPGQPTRSITSAQEGSTVTEVVVTAQKRVQNLQDVPVVVTVVNTKQLQDANVHDIKDLTILTSGLTVTSTGSDTSTTARIRGIGTVSDNIGLEDQVGIVIDGVERPRNGVAFNDLGELSDIEVLKGPQGTLFGANATAGVILVNSARPSFAPGADAEADFGNYSSRGGSASVTGPIFGDTLAGRLYIAGRSRDGFYHVDNPEGPSPPGQGDEHLYTARGQLLWKPTPTFDVNFIADYTKRNDHTGGSVPILNGLPSEVLNAIQPGATAVTPAPTKFVSYDNIANIENITDKGLSTEAHWTTPILNGAVVTSITGFRDYKDQSGSADTDATGADLLRGEVGTYTEFHQFTQELRYGGHTDRLDWLVGGYFKNEGLSLGNGVDYGTQYDQYLSALFSTLAPQFGPNGFNLLGGIANPATAFPAGQGTSDTYHQNETEESLFTQETYKILPKLEFTAGFRYTWDNKHLNSNYSNPNGSSAGCADAKRSLTPVGFALDSFASFYCAITNNIYDNLHDKQAEESSAPTGTAKLAYKFDRNLLVYGSYSRGYLVGGFNLARTFNASASGVPNANPFTVDLDTSFRPTFVNAYEVGEKASLFGRRLTLDGALFYQDYSDFQLNTFNGLFFVVTSVPSVVSRGAELSSTYQPTTGLSFNAGLTYADTYFPDSNDNKGVLNTPSGLERLPGHRLSLAPLYSVTWGGAYTRPVVRDLWLNLALDAKYSSSYNTGSDLDPAKFQQGFQLWDGTVGIGPHDGRWNVSLYAQNLFNTRYYQVAFNGALTTLGAPGLNTYNAFLGNPRTFGVTLRGKF